MSDLLRRLRLAFLGPPSPPALEEERFPRDAVGRPDLTRFTRPLDHYIGYVEAYLTSLDPNAPTATGAESWRHNRAWQSYAYRKGVLGQWGLIARGPAEALPYVLGLLRHKIPEARSSGAGVLEAWTDATPHPDLVLHVRAAAEREANAEEPDPETLSILRGLLERLEA